MPICGYLISSSGWECVFYATGEWVNSTRRHCTHIVVSLSGAVGLLWSFCWFTFTFESPAVHPRISIEERREIEEAIGSSTSRKRPSYVPWCDMFTSAPVWAIIITHGLSVFGFFTVINQLPTYMHDVLNFKIKEVGICLITYNYIRYIVCNIKNCVMMTFTLAEWSFLGSTILG